MRLIVLLGLTRWPLVASGARLSPSATVWALVGWVLLRLDRRLCRHKDADPASL
jgi:hypothetical protein